MHRSFTLENQLVWRAGARTGVQLAVHVDAKTERLRLIAGKSNDQDAIWKTGKDSPLKASAGHSVTNGDYPCFQI